MKHTTPLQRGFLLVFLITLVLLAGCREDEKELIVLPVEEVPEEEAGAAIEVDGDLSDWDEVEALVEITPSADNSLELLKAAADEDNLYLLIQGVEGTERAIFQIFVNTDNDTETGFDHWEQPGISGLDVLYEYDGATLYLYPFDPSDDPGWPWPSGDTNSEFGKVEASDDGSTYEVALSKAFMGELSEEITIKVMDFQQDGEDWVERGKLPLPEEELPDVEL